MAVKVVKSTEQVGLADDNGVSFTVTMLFHAMNRMRKAVNRQADSMGVTTGAARVYIIVEQDVITDGG